MNAIQKQPADYPMHKPLREVPGHWQLVDWTAYNAHLSTFERTHDHFRGTGGNNDILTFAVYDDHRVLIAWYDEFDAAKLSYHIFTPA